jgi:hypothetical protein
MKVIVLTALELGYGVNGKMKRRRLKVRDFDDVVLIGTKFKPNNTMCLDMVVGRYRCLYCEALQCCKKYYYRL